MMTEPISDAKVPAVIRFLDRWFDIYQAIRAGHHPRLVALRLSFEFARRDLAAARVRATLRQELRANQTGGEQCGL